MCKWPAPAEQPSSPGAPELWSRQRSCQQTGRHGEQPPLASTGGPAHTSPLLQELQAQSPVTNTRACRCGSGRESPMFLVLGVKVCLGEGRWLFVSATQLPQVGCICTTCQHSLLWFLSAGIAALMCTLLCTCAYLFTSREHLCLLQY